MATKNPPPLPTDPPVAQGYYMAYMLVRKADGTFDQVAMGGIGGPTATNGADTTSKIGHLLNADTVDEAWTVKIVSVTITAARVDNQPAVLTNRKRMLLKNIGAADIFIGPANTVTSSGATQGGKIPAGAAVELRHGARLETWAIVASSTHDLEIWQES